MSFGSRGKRLLMNAPFNWIGLPLSKRSAAPICWLVKSANPPCAANGEHRSGRKSRPAADASFLLYEDDGISFNYRRGEWTGIEMTWSDKVRTLELKLVSGPAHVVAAAANVQR